MRNATSIFLFGASTLVLSVGACGGGGGGSRDDAKGGTTSTMAGSGTSAGTTNNAGNTSASGASSGGTGGGAAACSPTPGSKAGDGKNLVIDDIDDTDTMFAPAGTGLGSWDFSKDTMAMGTITPVGTAALKPEAGGQMGSALHVTGEGVQGWGAALAAFLNGPTGAFDASSYGGVAFYIKGTTAGQDGDNKLMVQARMPDVLPGAGSCCDASATPVAGKECYSGHRAVIGVSAEWAEVRIAWADFKGPAWGLGSTMELNPNRVRDITMSFNHDAAATDDGASFDVWVDGVRFMDKDEKSNVMPGGSGGGGSGGSSGSGGTDNEGGAQ